MSLSHIRCKMIMILINILWFFSGVDENTIIEILVKRSNEQRQQIKQVYQQSSGKVVRVTQDGHSKNTELLFIHCSRTVMHMIIKHWPFPPSLWKQRWRTPWREIWRKWCWPCWKHQPSTTPISWNMPWRCTNAKSWTLSSFCKICQHVFLSVVQFSR